MTVANADGSAWTAVSGCSASDYAITAPALTYGDIAAGQSVSGSTTVTMVNNASASQDACKGVSVPLYFLAS